MSGFGIELKRHGAELIGRCPFHENHTPGLVVSPKLKESPETLRCLGSRLLSYPEMMSQFQPRFANLRLGLSLASWLREAGRSGAVSVANLIWFADLRMSYQPYKMPAIV